ncbi:hypothetical protein ACE6H2_021442 [Prunus campanulata]
MAMPDHAMDVIDPSLLIVRDDADGDDEIYNIDIPARPVRNYHDGSPVLATRLEWEIHAVSLDGWEPR